MGEGLRDGQEATVREDPAGAAPGKEAGAPPVQETAGAPDGTVEDPVDPKRGGLLPGGEGLLDRLLAHLQAGPDSISGTARALSAGRERPLHRLTVAGYLQALCDVGWVRRLDRPPSIQYALANPERHLSLHQRLGRALREDGVPASVQGPLLATALALALGRPAFAAELRHAGHTGRQGLRPLVLDDTERRRIRGLFGRRAVPAIDLPRGDPLLVAADPERWEAPARELLDRVLREATGVAHLAGPAGPHQAGLEDLA